MEPLVLLPGMMCDARLFTPQIARFSGQRVVHCAPITGADTIEELAGLVLAEAPPEFALAGLSMGGIVAMEIARIAPERVTRLCLMDTNHLHETPERQGAREPQIKAVRKGGLATVMREEMKPNYLYDGPHKTRILDICMEMANTLGPAVFERQSRALQRRRDQTDFLKTYGGKALVLAGRHDVLCPVSRHQQMAALTENARLTIIEEAGHMPTLEQPDPTNEALAAWLEKQ